MILQITETSAALIESAKHEPDSTALLFMLLVLVVVCAAFVKFYNDNKKERKENALQHSETNKAFVSMLEKLNNNIFDLSKNVAANTIEAQENRALLEKILTRK